MDSVTESNTEFNKSIVLASEKKYVDQLELAIDDLEENPTDSTGGDKS